MLQACEGLAEAHANGIVHRDLKPANLFLTRRPDGTPLVKVLDFGISKLSEAAQSGSFSLTQPRKALGSPQYMSPEQTVASPEVDQRADIWALGVILYELLSGQAAVRGRHVPGAGAGDHQPRPRAAAGPRAGAGAGAVGGGRPLPAEDAGLALPRPGRVRRGAGAARRPGRRGVGGAHRPHAGGQRADHPAGCGGVAPAGRPGVTGWPCASPGGPAAVAGGRRARGRGWPRQQRR